MTLIARLCTLCAMSALMQMVLPEHHSKGSLRLICGLLMLHLTISGLGELAGTIGEQRDLMGIFESLMK